jgi:3-oxoacyl-[acyl-carrier protein] reductase
MKSIAGKKVLITGAAAGIGRATALLLAEEGAQLYLLDINEGALNELAHLLRERGTVVVAETCDVADERALHACLTDLLDEWGGVDIVINNAAIVFYGPTAEMSDEQWEQVLATNLRAPTQIIRRLLPALIARGEGQIVNVCSLTGLAAFKYFAAYSLTKAGLLGFSESLRSELARFGVGVSAICPGFVITNMHKSALRAHGGRGIRLPSRLICTSPEAVAKQIVAAIRKNRFLSVVNPFARLIWRIKRMMPSLWPVLAAGFRRRAKAKAPDIANARRTLVDSSHSRAA